MAEAVSAAGPGSSRPILLFTNNWVSFFLSHRLALARAARDGGFQVHVAAPDEPEQTEIRREGFAFHPIRLDRRSVGPKNEAATVASLASLYRRVRPDIVHHVAMKAVLYGGVAARIAGVPAVVNAFTGLGWLFSGGLAPAFVRRIVRPAMRFALSHKNSRTIFQNPDDLATFTNGGLLSADRSVLIRGSGVDLEHFTPQPEPDGTPIVVLPARMLRSKGVAEFVSAARLLEARGVAVRMLLVGGLDEGNPTAVSEADLRAWTREGVVEWWGHRTDMREVLAAAQIVCLPSYREGLPKVLLEAAACARAIVASDVPGCREVVAAGDNGLLVPPRNPEALADAIEHLVKNPTLRRRMAARSRERAVAEFGISLIVQQTLELYRSLLAQR